MADRRAVAVIPARMGASRFPGKPLVPIAGLPMVEHVRRRALLSEDLDDVYVATCDREIAETVEAHGGKAVMTADIHERCTDRVEEAARSIDADVVAILQGDEPLFDPAVIGMMVRPLLEDPSLSVTNLVSVIEDEADLHDPDIVKAVLDLAGDIMYYSRSPIPYLRMREGAPMYRQTGLSAFAKEFLHRFSRLAPTPLEIAESVDFLRIREHGLPVRAVVFGVPTLGVDREEDVGPVGRALAEDPFQRALFERIR